uniref:ATP synthase complex subunit 8 n=2 Tax=Neobathyclupea TaxID=2306608 RepID=A0A0B6VM02_9TELE|nr:ATP synthase F0 subunit 8 [Bathyclupea megaceps]BAQ20959.1 ATPase subunit 8 [Bathyclupea argentea]BAX03842.1 ATPase subunit 8 [Bathyclupea megaceps]
MPQLIPAPWFAILIFSWATFLILLPPKILAHVFFNEPSPLNTKKSKQEPWYWPWH